MSIKPITNVSCAINCQDRTKNYDLQWTANLEGQASINTPQKITIKNAVLSFVFPKDSNIMIVPQIFCIFMEGSNNTTDYTVWSTEKFLTTDYKSSTNSSTLKLVLTNVLEINNIVDTPFLILDYRSIDDLETTLSASTLKGKFQAWNYNHTQNNPSIFPTDTFVWDPTGTPSTPSLKFLRANSFQISNRSMGNNIIFSFSIERTS